MNGNNKQHDVVKWIGIILTSAVLYGAFAMQQGKMQNTLENMDSKLSDISINISTMQKSISSLERRVSFLEGEINASRHPIVHGRNDG